LPICLGRATKFAEYFTAADKSYTAELVLGITTDTGDTSGEVLLRKEAAGSFEKRQSAAESFKHENGEYKQTPPMYSAIKIGGKKLYELARKGQTIDRPARSVKIHEINVSQNDNKIFLDITCSKGTYVRSLCLDIGEKLGCGAVMGELTRTRSGMFSIENSFSLEQVKTAAENGGLNEIILSVDKLLPYPAVTIKPEALARALNGNPIPIELIADEDEGELFTEKLWVKSHENRLIGLYSLKEKHLRAEVMF
jgi:tRNA pseudouridine55 synthase